MKTVKYLIITLLIFTIFAGSIAGTGGTRQTVLIQSTEAMISSSALESASKIITLRLDDLGVGKYKISVLPGEKQIKMVFSEDVDLNLIEKLITHNGVIEFWETYDRVELPGVLGENNRLLSLLPVTDEQETGGAAGCIPGKEITAVSNYLKAIEPGKRISFAWQYDHASQVACLYVLKAFDGGGPVITGSDVESAVFDSDAIRISLTEDASARFADATRRNLDKVIAILLDGEVISSPRVRSEILNGELEITGKFTKDEAGYVAALLNNGVLPSGFFVVE